MPIAARHATLLWRQFPPPHPPNHCGEVRLQSKHPLSPLLLHKKKTTKSDIQNITNFINEWSRVYFSTNRRAMRCSQNQNIYCMHHVKCIDVAAVEPRGLFGCQCHGQVVSYFVHKHSALHVDSRCENIHNDLNG